MVEDPCYVQIVCLNVFLGETDYGCNNPIHLSSEEGSDVGGTDGK